jgi:hypothetical protein
MAMPGKRISKRGRPPGPVDAVRPRRIVSYVTNAEFSALTRAADREAKSLSAIVHEILAQALDGPRGKSTPGR